MTLPGLAVYLLSIPFLLTGLWCDFTWGCCLSIFHSIPIDRSAMWLDLGSPLTEVLWLKLCSRHSRIQTFVTITMSPLCSTWKDREIYNQHYLLCLHEGFGRIQNTIVIRKLFWQLSRDGELQGLGHVVCHNSLLILEGGWYCGQQNAKWLMLTSLLIMAFCKKTGSEISAKMSHMFVTCLCGDFNRMYTICDHRTCKSCNHCNAIHLMTPPPPFQF